MCAVASALAAACATAPTSRAAGASFATKSWAGGRSGSGARATASVTELTQRILADVETWSQAPADLVDLHQRVDSAWRSWRDAREL